MNHIEIVGTAVGQLTAGVIVEPAEAVEGPIFVVGLHRCWPDPLVPVELFRRFVVAGVADTEGIFVLGVEATHHGDVADLTFADHVDCFLADSWMIDDENRPARPSWPCWQLRPWPDLLHTVSDRRLFDIDMLASLECFDGLKSVPMIWCGDDHCIHILVIEQFCDSLFSC